MLLLLLLADIPYDVEIVIRGTDAPDPTLLDVTSFLYDLNLVYEIGRLATDPRYEDYQFSPYTLFRDGRPLRYNERLIVQKLTH